MLTAILLAAQEQPDAWEGLLKTFGPIVLIFIALYFIVLRPAKRREQMQRELFLTSLKKNDKVLTSGGIIGHIANVNDKEEEVTLKLDESSNVRIRVLKSAIIRNYTSEEAAREQAAKDQKAGATKEEAIKAAKS
jgi:preprotein translocase subunit YajC